MHFGTYTYMSTSDTYKAQSKINPATPIIAAMLTKQHPRARTTLRAILVLRLNFFSPGSDPLYGEIIKATALIKHHVAPRSPSPVASASVSTDSTMPQISLQ